MRLLKRSTERDEEERAGDEADLSNEEGNVPTPQPEQREPELRDPGLSDLTARDYKAIIVRAGKQALSHGITDLAAALAYYSFLAIPAVLLVAVGLFSLFVLRFGSYPQRKASVHLAPGMRFRVPVQATSGQRHSSPIPAGVRPRLDAR